MQAGDDLDGEAAGDQSGYAIAINAFGNIIASGAPNNAGSGTGSGHVRVYQSNLCNIPLSVELLNNADASFDYTDSVYCSNASDPTPNITGNGGLFTSTAGLALDSASGVIDVSASSLGNYGNVPLSSGSCADSAFYDIAIVQGSYGDTNFVTTVTADWRIASIYTDTITNSIGCDSILILSNILKL